MTATVAPFRVEVSEETLEDLRRRLDATRFPEPLPGAGWDYGTDAASLRDLVEYWRHGYDWRATETRLNTLEQAITELDGQPVHFLHVRSPVPDALPLVLTHGWPGSIVEFLEVIGPLSDPAAQPPTPSTSCARRCPATGSQARPTPETGTRDGSLGPGPS
jgi:epoxide hydrolase